ncbi:MAG: helix-turn-helix domain-containing protein [Candidatus Tenebribacter mawsonii]|nr:helix-turn-helix domain-containing protein [Candidatus Tenebribacter mawsonii]
MNTHISKYSIAVLPFVNMSSEKDNEYFSDGITEEILNSLCKLNGLHVTARTSSFAFKNQKLDVREIGKKLNVAYILEGSIRKHGDSVRITAQLVKAIDGYHLWSNTWDKELKNIFIVQDEIASDIAGKIKTGLKNSSNQVVQQIENSQTIDLYLKACYLTKSWNQKETYEAIDLFNQVLELSPDNAKAYIGLADSYTLLGTIGQMSMGEASKYIGENILKAYQLDPSIAEIYIAFAKKSFWYEWDVNKTLDNLNKALELKPSNSEALYFKGMVYATYGKFEEALDYLYQSQRLNPLSEQVNYFIGTVYFFMEDYEKAVEYQEKNIKINPRFHGQYRSRIVSLCMDKRFDEAWDALRNYPEIIPDRGYAVKAMSGFYYACKGEKNKAEEIAEFLEGVVVNGQTSDNYGMLFLVYIYLTLNYKEQAIRIMEFGLKIRSMYFLFLYVDPIWKVLTEEPRYINAIKQFNYASQEKETDEKYKKSSLTMKLSHEIAKNLDLVIKEKQLFLNPQLTLSDLGEAIDISIHDISQVLNESIGKNFYEYINSFRLDHFIKLYEDPKYKQFTLLSIAFESGFNSKTTFNTFFKKNLSKSPSEYFKN